MRRAIQLSAIFLLSRADVKDNSAEMPERLNAGLEQEDMGKTERTAEGPEALLAEKVAVYERRMDARSKEDVQMLRTSAAKSSSGDLG